MEDNEPALIGFSLSFCIRQIAEGKVNIQDVRHIVTGCAPRNEEDMQELLNDYCKSYWKSCQAEARDAFHALRLLRKILWCSSWEKSPVNIGSFIWVKVTPENTMR